MKHLDEILGKLRGVRRSGKGWQAVCPVHPDRTPSLGITVNDDGRVNLRCFAGCDSDDVRVALGLSIADLFPDSTCRGRKVLRSFVYRDAAGVPVYRVDRTERAGRMDWSMAYPSGQGWSRKSQVVPRVLYRLPELLAAPDLVVWITEGERDAESLALLGMTSTTVASGCWHNVDLSPLAGCRFNVVGDNDEAGFRRMRETIGRVTEAGGIFEQALRPTDAFKDVTEFIAEGHTAHDLLPVDPFTEAPPARTWIRSEPPAPRTAARRDGSAVWIRVPVGLFLGWRQAGYLESDDLWVYVLMEDRAGPSSRALLGGAEVARLVTITDRRARGSLGRLQKVGLVQEVKRGEWRVHNPCWPGRMGEVDPRSIFYRNRMPPDFPALPPSPPTKSPGKGRWATVRQTGSAPSSSGHGSPADGSTLSLEDLLVCQWPS